MSWRIQSPTGGKHRLPALFALALGSAFVWAAPGKASTTLFYNTGSVCTQAATCYNAGSFGILVGLRNATGYQAETVNYAESGAVGADINGEIGVGPNNSGGVSSKIVFNSGTTSRTWDGPIDFANTFTGTAGPCTGSGCSVPAGNTLTRTQGSNTGNITVNGGTVYNPTKVQAAMTEMRDISAYWASQSGFSVTGFGTSGVNKNSFTGTGINVYTINDLINTTNNITITGDDTSLFIFNINSSTSNNTIPVQIKNNITLNGISSDQVFFNVLGSATGGASYQMSITSGTQSGIFYVAADNYNVNTTINGRVFGGVGTSNWGANFVLNAPADIPTSIPEPSTYVLLAAGLGALGYVKKRQGRERT